jgi:hypothetical protein
MQTSPCRTGATDAPHPLSAGEIGRRIDVLRDDVSALAAGGQGVPRLLAPADLLRCLASLTSRN